MDIQFGSVFVSQLHKDPLWQQLCPLLSLAARHAAAGEPIANGRGFLRVRISNGCCRLLARNADSSSGGAATAEGDARLQITGKIPHALGLICPKIYILHRCFMSSTIGY